MFMFTVRKHPAHKMVINRNYILQKTIINFDKPHFKTDQIKNQTNTQKREKLQHFALKNS